MCVRNVCFIEPLPLLSAINEMDAPPPQYIANKAKSSCKQTLSPLVERLHEVKDQISPSVQRHRLIQTHLGASKIKVSTPLTAHIVPS